MRIAIKFSCTVPDIDQLILMLSIPQIWNWERIIRGIEPEYILMIISDGLTIVEKRGDVLQVTRTTWFELGSARIF